MYSLVGNLHGRKVIRWGYVVATFLGIAILSGAFAAAAYGLAAKKWNPFVLLLGPAVGAIATILTLALSYATRIQRLPILK